MIFTGIGKIWDDKKQSTLCEFSPSGILNTEDTYIIKRMHELGYVEADEDEVVNINICNAVNVDWKERYDTLEAKYRALNVAYYDLKKKLADIENNMQIPVKAKESEERVSEILSDNIDVDGEFLPRDYETSMGIAQLKSFLKRHVDNLGDLRKYTKSDTLIEVNKFLSERGLIE